MSVIETTPGPPYAAIQGLLPGDRVRCRDWRDGRLVDGTHVGFVAKTRLARVRLVVGPAARAKEAAYLLEGEAGVPRERDVTYSDAGVLHGRAPCSVSSLSLSVLRDFSVGVRGFSCSDVVEVLDGGGTKGRVERLADIIRCNAAVDATPQPSFLQPGKLFARRGCPGCLAVWLDQNDFLAPHDPRCIGEVLVPELAAALEVLGHYGPTGVLGG